MVKKRLKDYLRVLSIARKPTRKEFEQAAKLSGLGMLVIGMVGFLIFMIFALAKLLMGWLSSGGA